MLRHFRLAAIATTLVAATTLSVSAQPPQGRGPGGGRMGPGGPAPVPLLRGLSLTDSQREQVRTIMEAQRGNQSGPPKLASLQRQLQLAILADAPDQGKIDQLRGAIAAAEAESLAARIDLESRIAQVLTPEQKAQARDSIENAPNGAPGGPGGRRGRGRP